VTDLKKLGKQKWDVVIDMCGYYPEHVKLSVDYLNDKATQYVYISSISAYEPTTQIGINEMADLQNDNLSVNNVEWWKGSYGYNKVLCEQIVLKGFGKANSLIIRPGAVIGSRDNNNFFTYWVVRIRLGGKTVAPGDGTKPLQFIDARDLVSFTNDMIEQQVSDIFTVTGPHEPILFSSFLNLLINYFNSNTILHWIDDQWLMDHEIRQDWEIPYWLPQEEGRGYFSMSIDKAKNKGLILRPLLDTVKDVIIWYDDQFGESANEDWVDKLPPEILGLKPTKEIKLLDEFLNRLT
jgi:2'-hydroxyisoflavone reductase